MSSHVTDAAQEEIAFVLHPEQTPSDIVEHARSLYADDIRDWLWRESSTGKSHGEMLSAMHSVGWDPAIAQEVLLLALTDQVKQQAQHMQTQAQLLAQAQAAPLTSTQPQPSAFVKPAYPYFDWDERRLYALDDPYVRPYVVTALPGIPIYVLGNFLSDTECEALIDDAKPHIQRSTTVNNETGQSQLHEARTSLGMFFTRGQTELLQRIEARIEKLFHWPVDHGEGMQILNYGPGAEYKPHYDYFDPAQPGSQIQLQRGGQRVGTIVMYLNNPTAGGATTFPDLDLAVAPKKGHAVFFGYKEAKPSSKSLHGSYPVVKGEKWVATKWLREGYFV